MQAVGVLARVDALEDRIGVDPARQRQLNDVTGAGRVGVEGVHGGLDPRLRGGLRQVDADGGDADLGAVGVLAGDVPDAPRVLADEHGAQPGRRAPLAQSGDAPGQLGLDRGGRGLAVQHLRGPAPGGPHWTSPG